MSAFELDARVLRKSEEAPGICAFELVSADGEALPAFSAGSHIDVQIPNGLTRQYSLCNSPSETHRYLIAVMKDAAGRGGSQGMHDLVQEGDLLKIGVPRNHFPLAAESERSLLLAGGIGITPILCMAEQLAMDGKAFELHYCTRTRDRMAFFERIRHSSFAGNAVFHVDDGDATQKLHLDALFDRMDSATHLYVCGPKGFMDVVLSTARAAGWPETRLHYEFFSAEKPVAQQPDSSFEVQLASSGQVVRIPGDKTVLQALADAGIEIPASCEQGVCGTCMTQVLAGEIDHRDLYLTAAEQAANDHFLPCCSRAKSAVLVLDL